LFALIEDIGAIAGIASFLVMLGLLGLYVVRARELRRLRRSAPFLVNAGNGQPATAGSRRGTSRGRRRRGGER
jgi:hypothetical protein